MYVLRLRLAPAEPFQQAAGVAGGDDPHQASVAEDERAAVGAPGEAGQEVRYRALALAHPVGACRSGGGGVVPLFGEAARR